MRIMLTIAMLALCVTVAGAVEVQFGLGTQVVQVPGCDLTLLWSRGICLHSGM